MPKDGTQTREKILDTAQALIYQRGFTATTLDRVLDGAGLTKGAFFHHFKNKDDLALALVERYLEGEVAMLEDLISRAEQLCRDPLQQIFIINGLMIEAIDGGEPMQDGCLFASYALELAEFDDKTRAVACKGFETWREIIGAKMAEAIQKHPPRIPTEPKDLADTMLAMFEGGMVISKLDNDVNAITRKMKTFNDYLELLFGISEADDAEGK
ncbi:MAG: TetR/AcrR family transcriptional regulator [Rhodospirillaceae bacterium]|jgi:TetR/AcrR family transcriptional regulator, transcriptional repressor for nem operon|nr:TetR/AcrR family transcriptional regulator [Rhodospirillaceae bacterium]